LKDIFVQLEKVIGALIYKRWYFTYLTLILKLSFIEVISVFEKCCRWKVVVFV